MRKIFLFFSVIIIPLSLFGWAQCRNTNGDSPEEPSTIYLGDTAEFGCDAWATDEGNWGRHQVVIHTSSDINNGTHGDWSDFNEVEHNTGISPRFTSSGTWYWGMKLNYGVINGWYCRNDENWHNMWETPTSDLTVTVNELSDPSDLTISPNSSNPNEALDISWNKDAQDHSVLLVRRKGNPVMWSPTQGEDYSDWQDLGDDTIIIRGSEASTSITDNNNGSGLEPNTMYYYKLYSENYQYYSSGITGEDHPLPVTLSGFSAAFVDGTPTLYWTTEDEENNAGWNIYRGLESDAMTNDQTIQLNLELIPGAGTTNQLTSYEFVDEQIINSGETYWYWLESVDTEGVTEIFFPTTLSIPDDSAPFTPETYGLYQNHPNPFNPDTMIRFALETSGYVNLVIFDIKGSRIKTLLADEFIPAETLQEKVWNGTDENGKSVGSGIYLYRLQTAEKTWQKKMLLVK